MAKKAKNTDADGEESVKKKKTSIDVLTSYVSGVKNYGIYDGDFYENYSDEIISTGCPRLDIYLDGGYRPGIIIAFGEEECGKTAFGLSLFRQWQIKYGEKAACLYIDAEGRLTKRKIVQSGIELNDRFIVVKIGGAEDVYDIAEGIIKDNPDDLKWFIIVDSVDAIGRKEDLEKSLEEAPKMAGGATVQSAALKRLSLPVHSLGHMLYLISQVRVSNMTGRGGGSKPSGGNAPRFYSDFTIRFKKPWSETYIEKNNEIIGNKSELAFTKTYNEKTGGTFILPIKRNHVGGIWLGYSVYMMCVEYGLIEKKGSWVGFSDFMIDASEVEFSRFNLRKFKYQGELNFVERLEKDKEIMDYLIAYVKELYKEGKED